MGELADFKRKWAIRFVCVFIVVGAAITSFIFLNSVFDPYSTQSTSCVMPPAEVSPVLLPLSIGVILIAVGMAGAIYILMIHYDDKSEVSRK